MTATRPWKVPIGFLAALCTGIGFLLAAHVASATAASQVILSKSNDTGGSIVAGGTFHYEISVQCNGPNGCPGTTVTDTVPAGLTIISAVDLSNNSSCTIVGQLVTCPMNGIGSSNSTDTMEITVQVPADTPLGVFDGTNCADVSSTQIDFCTGIDTPKNGCPGASVTHACDTAGFTVVPSHDLEVVKTLTTPASVPAGGIPGGTSVTYQVVATNNGPSTIAQADMSVTDTVSGTVAGTITDVTVDSGSLDCGTGPWTSPVTCNATADWLSGASATFHITIALGNTSGTITNTATVPETNDPDTTNNSSAVTNDVCQSVDLTLTKTCQTFCPPTTSPTPNAPVCPTPITQIQGGTEFTYHIVITNTDGSIPATNVVFDDPLPPGVSLQNVTGDQCTTGTIAANTCVFDTIPAGGSKTFDINVIAVDSGDINNSAGASADQCDRTPSDNTDQSCSVTVLTNNMPTALEVDREASSGTSDVNRVFEPDETVRVDPAWTNTLDNDDPDVTGSITNFTGPAGATYNIIDSTADYGAIPAHQQSDCNGITLTSPNSTGTGDCYELQILQTDPNVRPHNGNTQPVHWDAQVLETLSTGETHTWQLHIGDSFTDVPRSDLFYRVVETIYHNHITAGCGDGTLFCPFDFTTREQMAAFITRSILGLDSLVPSEEPNDGSIYNCTDGAGGLSQFLDVPPATAGFCRHINYLKFIKLTAGCTDSTHFCPSNTVTRGQMAVFVAGGMEILDGNTSDPLGSVPLWKQSADLSREYNCTSSDQIDPDTSNTIPANTSPFPNDVPATDTPGSQCPFIGFLYVNHVVSGDGAGSYFPTFDIKRDETAAILSNAFVTIPLYGPEFFTPLP